MRTSIKNLKLIFDSKAFLKAVSYLFTLQEEVETKLKNIAQKRFKHPLPSLTQIGFQSPNFSIENMKKSNLHIFCISIKYLSYIKTTILGHLSDLIQTYKS